MFQRVEHEAGVHAAGGLPADDAAGEHVDDEGHVDDPRPRRAVREVGHPGRIWAGGAEVTLHEVRGAHRGRVGAGREPLAGPAGAADALGSHEPGHLVAAGLQAGPAGGLGELAAPVDRVVALLQRLEARAQLGVTLRSGRRRPGRGVVVGGGGDLQSAADRLDPPSQPTGLPGPVGVDEGDYFLGRPSSSVAKKIDAALRMSFALRSSRFSRSSSAMRCASAVDVPGRRPESTSAWFTQPRYDSAPIPSSRATRVTARGAPRSARGSPAPSAPIAHATRPDTSAASAALQFQPCSILVSKVRSLQETQADSVCGGRRNWGCALNGITWVMLRTSFWPRVRGRVRTSWSA
jgi:hypothetical protein